MGHSIAIHIEVADGDVEAAKVAARKLGRDIGARQAVVSTHEGSWDVLQDDTVEAETMDGQKVQIKNSAAYIPVAKLIERVAPDPTPEQIREARGEGR